MNENFLPGGGSPPRGHSFHPDGTLVPPPERGRPPFLASGSPGTGAEAPPQAPVPLGGHLCGSFQNVALFREPIARLVRRDAFDRPFLESATGKG